MKEFRSRPFSYWLGRDEPFTYEANGDRVFRVSRSQQVEIVVFAAVDQWSKIGRKLVIYERETAHIIMDPRNRLGSVLEKHLPEKQIMGEDYATPASTHSLCFRKTVRPQYGLQYGFARTIACIYRALDGWTASRGVLQKPT